MCDDDEPRCQQHVLRRCDARSRRESGRPTSRTRTRLGRSRAFPRSGGESGLASVRACPVARRPPGQPSGSCGEEASSAYRIRARPGLRGSRRSRVAGAPRGFRRRSGTPRRLHRAEGSSRSTGDTRVSAQRVNSPRVSRPPLFPFRKPPPEFGPPEFAPNPPASTPTHRADSARFPSHPQRSSRAPAETTRSRAPSRPSPPRRRRTRRSATPRPRRPGLRSRAAATDR